MRRSALHSIIALLGCSAPLAAQATALAPSQPHATVVRAAELERALRASDTSAVADAVLRVLPVEDAYNVGVSVVRRSRVRGQTPPDAVVHDAITEVALVTFS